MENVKPKMEKCIRINNGDIEKVSINTWDPTLHKYNNYNNNNNNNKITFAIKPRIHTGTNDMDCDIYRVSKLLRKSCKM